MMIGPGDVDMAVFELATLGRYLGGKVAGALEH